MDTIIIKLDSEKLENPDLDIIYNLPERIEEYTNKKVNDNGYDYLLDIEIGLWFDADSEERYKSILKLIKNERFSDNDLSKTAEIYISKKDTADIDECRKVYPL